MNPTCDPKLRSFVPVAPDSHFPIQNLPLGVFRPSQQDEPRIGVAIGDWVLDLLALAKHRLLDGMPLAGDFFLGQHNLNAFLGQGPSVWRPVRTRISQLLRHDESSLRDNVRLRDHALVRLESVEMLLPVQVGDYSDFYSSREHASNVGTMMRGPQNALMPNWLHVPIAYHGRASSIVVSGTDVRRPCGQTTTEEREKGRKGEGEKGRKGEGDTGRTPAENNDKLGSPSPLLPLSPSPPLPTFGPSKSLDFELELGFLVGPGNRLGTPIPIVAAAEHLFGVTLVNDWSARDVQRWEYQPLGPFLSKSFATSMAPWVVPLEALEPFRGQGPVQDPAPLPYLRSEGSWNFDIRLEVLLQTARMDRPERISVSNAKYLYWNCCQQLAHQTSNGCNLQPGDLLATGTISGPTLDSYGSLLELAWKGTKPLQLATGETRSFLQDGDRLTLTGWCEGAGYRVGLGEVTAKILPASVQ